jgi:ABC-type sugar transport system permease subunit
MIARQHLLLWLPLVAGQGMSLTDDRPCAADITFVGLCNYARIFQDDLFQRLRVR